MEAYGKTLQVWALRSLGLGQQQVFIYSKPITGIRAKWNMKQHIYKHQMTCEEHIYALRFKYHTDQRA